MKIIFFLILAKIFLFLFVFSCHSEEPAEIFHEHEELFELYQPYLVNISGYKPIYFLFGVNLEDTKYQLSLKYRFISPESFLVRKYGWLRGFHIAYTQTSFWDLKAESKPFDDTSYKPELFFLTPNILSGKGRSHLFFQTGYEHESNGQAGETSRSTNYLYIQPVFVFFHKESSLGFQLSPKIWTYVVNSNSTNPDLYQYRGYFNLQLKAGRADRFVLDTHWRWAKKGHSISLDLTYPFDHFIKSNLQLFLHIQYVNALAESLIDYTERNEAVRIGVSIVR